MAARAAPSSGPVSSVAGHRWVRSALPVPRAPAHCGDDCLPHFEEPIPRTEVCEACESADNRRVYSSLGRRAEGGREGVEVLKQQRKRWRGALRAPLSSLDLSIA